MATAIVTEQCHLVAIRAEIFEAFDRILSEVKARRDELLAQLDKLRKKIESENDSILVNIRGLEEMRAYSEKMPVKQNLVVKKQRESLADIDSEIQNLKIGLVDISNVKFNCSIDQLINEVKQIGNVSDGSSIESKYRSKLTVVKVMREHIPNGRTIKLYIDFHKQFLYVYSDQALPDKQPISVFNANEFTFIRKFGHQGDAVHCMATGEDFIYTTISDYYCNSMRVLLYKQSDYSLVKKLAGYADKYRICNIFINTENQVMLLVRNNQNQNYDLDIYDRALNLEREVKLIYRWPSQAPKALSLLRDEGLYLLLDKELLVFNKEGKNINTIFGTKGNSPLVKSLKTPTSFYITGTGYILVSDRSANFIKFFSPEGDLFHTLGGKTVGSDIVLGAHDVVDYKGNLIVACYDDTPSYTCHDHPYLRIY